MHFSAPSHPLIHAFLLQGVEFRDARTIIVENLEQGEKLFAVLESLREIQGNKRGEYVLQNFGNYRLVRTQVDALEVTNDTELIGIFTPESLDWLHEKWTSDQMFVLTKWQNIDEEKLITWLTEHGYNAGKWEDEWMYFRQWDTVKIQTRKWTLFVSFFDGTIEDLILEKKSVSEWKLFARFEK
jgi:hypothetical protein